MCVIPHIKPASKASIQGISRGPEPTVSVANGNEIDRTVVHQESDDIFNRHGSRSRGSSFTYVAQKSLPGILGSLIRSLWEERESKWIPACTVVFSALNQISYISLSVTSPSIITQTLAPAHSSQLLRPTELQLHPIRMARYLAHLRVLTKAQNLPSDVLSHDRRSFGG